mgnify:FL=1
MAMALAFLLVYFVYEQRLSTDKFVYGVTALNLQWYKQYLIAVNLNLTLNKNWHDKVSWAGERLYKR